MLPINTYFGNIQTGKSLTFLHLKTIYFDFSAETIEYVGLVKRPKTPLITARQGEHHQLRAKFLHIFRITAASKEKLISLSACSLAIHLYS
jgi:hypothetical protein